MRKNILIFAFVIVTLLGAIFPSIAKALPSGFEIQTIASGLNLPTTVAFTPDGRILIAEKGGAIKIIKNGVLLTNPLITLSDVNAYGDRGLIGMAVDPNFSQNGYLYLAYTYENTPGLNYSGIKTARVVRVTVTGDTASESSKLILIGSIGGNINTPSCDNYAVTSDCIASDSPSHTIGGIRFGTDGKLYVTTGDGAHFDYADTRSLRAQNLDSLAGKILRINTDGTAPSDNPFYTGNPNDNRSKVYAYGFRNAFRFNFRPTNNSIYSGDVGWSSWEEVNKVIAGGNYGWPCIEGNLATVGHSCTAVGAINPIYTYAHDINGAGSVTGGAFPIGSAYPIQYANTYFFGDYAQNWIKTMTVNTSDAPQTITDFASASDGTNGPVEFVTGPEGNIYFLSIYTGELKKITHTLGNRQPITNIGASATSGLAPLSINFSSAGSSDPDGNPITYLWNFGNGITSTLANPSYTYTTNGVYNATLTVFDNQGGQQTKSIKITVGNHAPTATIISPISGSLYTVGQNLILSGVGTDPETGTLPTSALSWRVILHHNTHTHDLESHIGNNISFTGPDHGDPDVYTEIELTVTDNAGLTHKTSVNIYLNNAGGGNGNLVDNPDLETSDPSNPFYPANWHQDWWGNLSPIFTYPAPGYEGVNMRGAKVEITAYTSGDAKWVFAPISTNPNTTYTFSNNYLSNTVSTLVAEVVNTNGTYTYINLGSLPASTGWSTVTKTFTTPANAKNVTILHVIDRVGSLTVDNYSLTLGTSTSPVTDTTKPLISINSPIASSTVSGIQNIIASSTDNVGVVGVKFLIDGVQTGVEDTTAPYSVSWNTASSTNGIRTLLAVARDLAGNIATSTAVNVVVSNAVGTTTGPNLLSNGTFEAGSTMPTGWTKGGWGINTRSLTYPVTGANSTKAARVQITDHTSGDAKWVHAKIPVTPGKKYSYKDKYRSNIISDIIGEYTLSNGTLSYFGLSKEIQPNSNWTEVSGTFSPPVNATQVTFYHLISSVGWVEIDDVEIREIGAEVPGETISPIVEFTNPLQGQTVSGIVNITASSTDNTAVTYIFYAVDGAPITGQLTNPPYLFAWNSNTVSNGPHLLKATTHDPSGNNSTSTITIIVNNATSTPDTTKPLISINSPIASSTVSGIQNIIASSTDNVGVVGVKFLIDGVQTGVEDTTAPYSVSWNTASSTNGIRTLLAVARDLAGNIATSTAVNVVVSNVAPPVSNNIILNNSVEIANVTKPLNWNTGKWGTNTTTFTYPTIGQEGAKAVGITMTAYTSGDAKWFFDDVTVTPGTQYTFSEYYKSNVVTNVTVRWTSSTGAVTYQSLGNPPAATNWTLRTNTITVPAGVTKMTVFHLLNKIGTLEVDNYSLVGPGVSDTVPPTVSILSPIDGSNASSTVNVTISATDNIAVSKIDLLIDGNPFNSVSSTTTASFPLDTKTISNGSHMLMVVATDSSGNKATTTSSILVNNTFQDTEAPNTTITNPTNGATVSGNVNIGVTAIDNVAVSSVHIFVDGISVVMDDTYPYEATIDTTVYPNGTHTITAYSEDSSNNIGNATPVVITTNNAPTNPPALNLISNPSLETTDMNDSSKPENWYRSNWGTNITVFTYPASGNHLSKAARVEMTSYTDGDAKWFFADVPVVEGETYTFKSEYKSNVSTKIVARFGYPDNSVQYRDIANLSSTTVWTNTSNDILIPPDADKITIFHIINSVGVLEVDNYYLGASISEGNMFSNGMVSLTFDDGWVSHYTEALPILNTSDLKAGFYIISQETLGAVYDNRVSNPNLEVTNASVPTNWNTEVTGINDASFTYPISGQTGNGARVEINSYTNGDAKWVFSDATAISGQEYKISFYYRSDVDTPVIARFTLNDNSTFTYNLGVATTSTSWNKFERNLYMPVNLKSVTFYVALDKVGFIETDTYDLNRVPVFLSPSQVQQIKAAGHEIGSHTKTHPYLTTLNSSDLIDEISGSKIDLSNTMGIQGVNTFVYPYGDYNNETRQAVINAGYFGGRSVDRGLNYRDSDKFTLKIQQVDRTTNMAQFQSWIDDARNNKAWLILMFHQVDSNPEATLGVTPALFQEMVNALEAQQVTVVTMEQGLGLMNP